MKKLGKKLSYFTKVLLVLGLLFNNLSSLSVVFADVETDNFTIALTDENEIQIDYLAEIDSTDEVTAVVSENYTYLDDESELTVTNNHLLTGGQLVSEEGVVISSTMLSSIVFDGLYEVSVSLYNETDEEDLGTLSLSKDIVHEKGLAFKLYDEEDNEIVISPEDDRYHIVQDKSKVVVKYSILPGGFAPSDTFTYEETLYTISQLLEKELQKTFDFNGLLFGEYSISLEEKMLDDELQEVSLSSKIDIMYQSYEDNTLILNEVVSNMSEIADGYLFKGEEKDGTLYVLLDETTPRSVLDLYNIAAAALNGSEDISFDISNSEYESYEAMVLAYEEAKLLDDTLTLEDYLEEILLDNSTVFSLSSNDMVITYTCILVGDANEDGLLNQDDLEIMIAEIIKPTINDLSKLDVSLDGDFSENDILYLHQVLKNKTWEVNIVAAVGNITSRLEVSDDEIVSGDEFTISYILNLSDLAVNGISGVLNYDDTMLELIENSFTPYTEWYGSNDGEAFFYLGNESLSATGDASGAQQPAIEPEDYTVLTVTFKALKAGTTMVKIQEPKYVDQNSYYDVHEDVTLDVVINASDDNSLSSLTVAGQEIELVDGELEYSITVENEVTSSLVEAIASNVAASISSIVSPEELVEGDNTITIVVTAENGDEKIYTITVTRKEAPVEEKKEETINLNYSNNTEDDEDDTTLEQTPSVNDKIDDDKTDDDKKVDEEEKESNISRIIIIILILLVIAGLIYLIFKDDKDDEEKKANKEINKLKKKDDFHQEKKQNNSNKSKNKKKRK